MWWRRSGLFVRKISNGHYYSADTVLSHPPTRHAAEPEPWPHHTHSPRGRRSEWQSHPVDRGHNLGGLYVPHRHMTWRGDVMLELVLPEASPMRVGFPCMGFPSVALRHDASRRNSDNTACSDICSASRPMQSVGLLQGVSNAVNSTG